MPTSARVKIPFPTENQDPYYDAFTAMVDAIDASIFAAREDRHIVMMNGGSFAFTVIDGVGTLSWSQDINVLAAVTGFLWTVPAGSITIPNGMVAYINIPRAPVQSASVAMLPAPSDGATNKVPNTDEAMLFGIHKDSIFYFRNGRTIHNGEVFNALETSSVGGGGGSSSTRAVKDPCRAATTGPVTLAGGAPGSVDGYIVSLNDRILVKNQIDITENGIYTVTDPGGGGDGTWIRASDFATSADVIDGAVCVVTEGALYGQKMFELVTTDPVIIGTSAISWALLSTIGAPGESIVRDVAIANNGSTTLMSPLSIGHYAYNNSDYRLTGSNQSVFFKAIAYVTGTADGSITLYNLTSATVEGVIGVPAGTSAPTLFEVALTPPVGNNVYELRIQLASGAGILFCSWAGLQFRNELL